MLHDLENKYGDVSKEAIIVRKTLEEEHNRNEIDKKLLINSVRFLGLNSPISSSRNLLSMRTTQEGS